MQACADSELSSFLSPRPGSPAGASSTPAPPAGWSETRRPRAWRRCSRRLEPAGRARPLRNRRGARPSAHRDCRTRRGTRPRPAYWATDGRAGSRRCPGQAVPLPAGAASGAAMATNSSASRPMILRCFIADLSGVGGLMTDDVHGWEMFRSAGPSNRTGDHGRAAAADHGHRGRPVEALLSVQQADDGESSGRRGDADFAPIVRPQLAARAVRQAQLSQKPFDRTEAGDSGGGTFLRIPRPSVRRLRVTPVRSTTGGTRCPGKPARPAGVSASASPRA